MRPRNPACYECPKDKKALHTWRLNGDGTATCIKCKLKLSPEDTADCYRVR